MSEMLPTHVVDCGTNKSTVYVVADNNVITLAHDELLNYLTNLPSGSFVYGEQSHLGCPRGKFSLSQPYKAELLLDLYETLESNGVKLRFFPQKSTPRACAYAGLPKNDDTDPIAIYTLVKDFPKILESSMKPPKTFGLSPVRKESYDYKSYTDLYINMARVHLYTEDNLSKWLLENIDHIYDNMSSDARSVFSKGSSSTSKGVVTKYREIRKIKAGENKGKINPNTVSMQALYAVACTIIDYDGNVRVRESTGEMAGWKYVKKYIIRMSPYHFKGGVARSNLYHHGMKNWTKWMAEQEGFNIKGSVGKAKSRGGFFHTDAKKKGQKIEDSQFTKEEDDIYLKYRKVYCDCIREVWQLIRDMKQQDQDSACHSVSSEFSSAS
tara:strand:- start:287 stop:1432 length:1146 start_codon:yes stop_codon:yes gene_type:complete